MSRKTLSDRFWTKVKVGTDEDCWPWQASLHDTGYGQIYFAEFKGKSRKEFSHRAVWLLEYGTLPAGMHVLHRCDNRKCCNPRHLFLGTNDDNIADKVRKGRQERGEAHSGAKLSEEQVRLIRNDSRSLNKIAATYGVNGVTVYDAKARRTWKHVE